MADSNPTTAILIALKMPVGDFDLHISKICKKAARQINVLLRLIKFLSTETNVLTYKYFVRSNFNYCPLVWHFCSKTSSKKMENYNIGLYV